MYGARPLKRTIQSMLQNAVADRLLDGNLSGRDELVAYAEGEKIQIRTGRS